MQKTTGKVTIFACDRKKSGGSIISSRLVSGATGAGGFIDTKCGVDNAGYESSNDLTIGRTFVSLSTVATCLQVQVMTDVLNRPETITAEFP